MNRQLPLYELTVSDSADEMYTISLVDEPAIEVNWVCLKKDTPIRLQADKAKQILYGPAIIPDKKIYRRDESGEYEVYFSKETIIKLVERWSKRGYANCINIMHDSEMYTDSCTLVTMYIIDREMGLVPTQDEFKDLPDGTLMVGYHVEDSLWELIESGEVNLNGFSIEAFMTPQLVHMSKENEKDSIELLMDEVYDEADDSKWLVDGDGEYWLDEDGNKVPSRCPKCGGKVIVTIEGEPIFKCKECGEYLGTVMFPYEEFGLDFSSDKKKVELKEYYTSGDIKEMMKTTKVYEFHIGDKTYNVQIFAVTDYGMGVEVMEVDHPEGKNRWLNFKLDEISKIVETTIEQIPFDYSHPTYLDYIKDGALTTQETITAPVNRIEEAMMKRQTLILNYNDEQPNPHTSARQCVVVAWGQTKRGNDCLRVLELFGDSRSIAEGYAEQPLADYRLLLTKRITQWRVVDFAKPWDETIFDSRVNRTGDDSMKVIYKHYSDYK